MQAYHSAFNEEEDMRLIGNVALLPIKSRIRGSAPIGALLLCLIQLWLLSTVPVVADPNSTDIIDETLDLFRANSLFRNFEIKGPADRLLIILILFISDCLAKVVASRTPPSQLEATKSLGTLAVDSFALPGDATFPLNAHYQAPGSRIEAGEWPSFRHCGVVSVDG